MFGVEDPATELAVATYVKLLRAVRAVTARVEPRLTALALTGTQLGVLEAVLHKGPLTNRELSRLVLTSAANMSDVIDKLAARGLVVRGRCPGGDRRLVRVALTDCGHGFITGLFPGHADDIAAAMAGLDTAELTELACLLRRLGMAAARLPAHGLAKPCGTDHVPDQSFDIEQQGVCRHDPRRTV